MQNEDFFFQAFVYLMAAVLSVPIAKRLGLGSVLGYLIAGIVIGPFVMKLVGNDRSDDVMHFAEFGVVMMLFLVGLELQPSLLWRLRVPILGLGGLQVAVTTLVTAAIALVFGVPWPMAIAIGMILSMSSTAIALQSLNERGLSRTEGGQSAFSVLLFQDIAVIPILAVLPLLALPAASQATNGIILVATGDSGSNLPAWQQALLVMVTVGGIVAAGRFLMQPVFRFIATTRLREIFTATALLLVISIALAMQQVGLSPALGTFLAGVVLAENEYRHELEGDIEPFKGLLLGLFFISVGASINFNVLFQQPILILGMVLALAIAKFLILFGLGWFFKLELSQTFLLACALAQGGEFAFVLFSFATQNNVLPVAIAQPLVVVVALSMMLTPLILIINDRLIQPRFSTAALEQDADEIDDNENLVIIAGRLLAANGCNTTVLDHNPSQIDMLRRYGFKVFYGDASRLDLLHAAGAERARLLIIAIDDRDKILEIAELAQKHFPHLKVLARAIDREHAYELINRGVDVVRRETFGSALQLGVDALKLMGTRAYKAHRAGQLFKQHDEQAMFEMAGSAGDETLRVARSRQLAKNLERLLQSDDRDFPEDIERAWDTTALRKEA